MMELFLISSPKHFHGLRPWKCLPVNYHLASSTKSFMGMGTNWTTTTTSTWGLAIRSRCNYWSQNTAITTITFTNTTSTTS